MSKKLKDPSKLFDFISIMFTDKDYYKKLRSFEKSRHFFMVNRFMSIAHPVQANHLQHTRVNPSAVLDYWQDTMTRLYSRVPGWMYTKTSKKNSKNKQSVSVEDSTIEEYCRRMQYSKRQVNDALEFFPDEMTTELVNFENMIKGYRK